MRHVLTLAVLLLAAPASAAAPAKGSAEAAPGKARKIEITVTHEFQPSEIKLKKGEPATLVFTRTTDRTCMTAVDIPDENVKNLELPLGKPVAVTITPKKAGVEAFHCSAMAMGNGKIVVE